MTDLAKRGSNICGIATNSWPVSDFMSPSAAFDRPLRPSIRSSEAIRLYMDFVALSRRKKAARGGSPVWFARQPVLCYRSAGGPFRIGAPGAQEGSLIHLPA